MMDKEEELRHFAAMILAGYSANPQMTENAGNGALADEAVSQAIVLQQRLARFQGGGKEDEE